MAKRKPKTAEPLTADDIHYVRAVRDAELAVQTQESRVAHAKLALRNEAAELRNKMRNLRAVAGRLPLFEGQPG